jgi:hypothetical protein
MTHLKIEQLEVLINTLIDYLASLKAGIFFTFDFRSVKENSLGILGPYYGAEFTLKPFVIFMTTNSPSQ